jgi:hypothetical protein
MVIIAQMKALEVVAEALALALYATLISLPGLGVSYVVWRYSRSMRPVLVQTLFRAAIIAIAATPSVHGHAGILPAIFLTFALRGRERLAGIIPIIVVWLIAIPVIQSRAKNRRPDINQA